MRQHSPSERRLQHLGLGCRLGHAAPPLQILQSVVPLSRASGIAMLPSGQKWTTSKEIASSTKLRFPELQIWWGECMSDGLPCILIYVTLYDFSPTFCWLIPFQDPQLERHHKAPNAISISMYTQPHMAPTTILVPITTPSFFFLFLLTDEPIVQPELYQSFAKETSHLEQHFGHLGESGSYILGDDAHGLQWHVYVVGEGPAPTSAKAKPVYTLEVCMTELCPAKVCAYRPHHTSTL